MLFADPKIPKNPKNYNYVICMLNTCNKKYYERHLLTAKDKKGKIF